MSRCFRTIVVVDFEYEIDDGDLPRVLCMVAYVLDANLRHVQHHPALARRVRLNTAIRYRSRYAVRGVFSLGRNDVLPAARLAVPGARLRSAHRLSGDQQHPAAVQAGRELARRSASACRMPARAYGIEGWENIDKPDMAKAIGEGRWREYGREAVLQYCEEDTRVSAELLRRQLTGYGNRAPVDPGLVMHWSEYSAKTVARIQARGMPIDMPLWNLVQENKRAVIGALIRRFDPSQGSENPIYSPDGEWGNERFAHWLAIRRHRGMAATGLRRARADGDAFRMMYGAHPAIEGPACAARQSRRHRARPNSDRPRRPQPAEPVSVRHRDRPQRSGQKPVQRPRQHALVHEVSTRQDRALSRLANAGGRHCGGAQRRRGTGGRLSIGRRLSRARNALRPDQRHRHQALEGRQSRPAPANEGAAARHQLRHGRALAVARPQPAPADRQRSDHPASAPVSAVLGVARRTWSSAPCWSA